MTVALCHGITRAGERCRARPLVGATYCLNHSPTITDAQRRAWAARGGANSSARARAKAALPAAAMGADEIGSWLGICFKRVIAERMDPSVANAVSGMAKAMLAVQAASEIEERLAALEEAVAAQAPAATNRRYSA